MVFPIAAQSVIVILLSQLFIVAKRSHNLGEVLRQCRAVRAFGLAFQVTLELPRLLNLEKAVGHKEHRVYRDKNNGFL